MYFTEGKMIEYERMMKDVPGFYRKPAKTKAERECKLCLRYDACQGKCMLEKCDIFED